MKDRKFMKRLKLEFDIKGGFFFTEQARPIGKSNQTIRSVYEER